MATPITSRTETLQKYLKLDQKGQIMAEYVWVDADGGTRSKSRTLPEQDYKPEDLPVWNFDGSSTNQAPGDNSDVYLRPCAVYPDPFRGSPNIIVLAECWNADGTPNKYNFRHDCVKVMDQYADEVPWFGLEQEYTLLGSDDRPYGWPAGGFPAPQGEYYCGVGTGKVVQRDIVEAHYKACLYAGIQISGTNAEVMPAQWEYQVGPCTGIATANRQFFQWVTNFGSRASSFLASQKTSAQSNFSTKAMREEGGMKLIEEALKKLEPHHAECIAEYGEDNDLRLTGRHETGSIDSFSWGVANRGTSIRVPRETAAKGYGYFEDRRPASNADPYRVTKVLLQFSMA
ncbi:glutamine synthetase [Fusarium avenaceum]|nr:glutamine synthetase [Fusarium avenaceum]